MRRVEAVPCHRGLHRLVPSGHGFSRAGGKATRVALAAEGVVRTARRRVPRRLEQLEQEKEQMATAPRPRPAELCAARPFAARRPPPPALRSPTYAAASAQR